MGEAARRHGDQRPRQIFRRLMREAGEDHLVQRIGLALDGFHNPRVAMTMGDHPPGGDGIQQPAFVGFQPSALAVRHQGGVRRQGVLGEGMPDRRSHAKSAASKVLAKTAASRPGVKGSITGSRPSRFALPISAMIFSLSGLASPMKATPNSGMSRLRIASSDSSVWLMVPSWVRAQRISG